jgi:thioredoxin-dependent adenylylsulfate APS reductase
MKTAEHGAEVLDELEVGELAVQFEDQGPEAVLAWGLEQFGRGLALVTSFQAEGMVVLDMAVKIDPRVRVITIDSGRLPEETHVFLDRVRSHYGVAIEAFYPDAEEVRRLVTSRGTNAFYDDLTSRLLCCQVRKVRPLLRALRTVSAWVTGLRRDQWASRVNIRKVELDHDHGAIVKLNPLADWTADEVRAYVAANGVPQHPLYARGYTSIGCAPCTRAVTAGQDPRSGRWWWEKNAPKECGMHCSIETGGFEHELEALLAGRGKHHA